MANMTVTPATLEAVARIYAPTCSSSFPIIGRRPSKTFSAEPSQQAVLIGDYASGYPLQNKQFTFDGLTFTPELRSVFEADKLIVLQFYEDHKDVPFPWYNNQDDTWYTVIFTGRPRCRLDGRKDLWKINLEFRQAEPL